MNDYCIERSNKILTYLQKQTYISCNLEYENLYNNSTQCNIKSRIVYYIFLYI